MYLRLVAIFFFFIYCPCKAQKLLKPAISIDSLNKWPYCGAYQEISSDGMYVAYRIDRTVYDKSELVVMKASGQKVISFLLDDFVKGGFSDDAKKYIWLRSDSMFIIDLGSRKIKTYNNVTTFSLIEKGKTSYLVYLINDSLKTCVIQNLTNGNEDRIKNVNSFKIAASTDYLILEKHTDRGLNKQLSLVSYNLANKESVTIWKDSLNADVFISEYITDPQHDRVAFTIRDSSRLDVNSIWISQSFGRQAEKIVFSKDIQDKEGLLIAGDISFSKNGRWLFFNAFKANNESRLLLQKTEEFLDLWSYKDSIVNPDQHVRLKKESEDRYLMVVPSSGGQVNRIEYEDECIEVDPQKITGNYIVLQDHCSILDYWWNTSSQPSYYLVSLIDGNRKVLKKNRKTLLNFSFSPNGKYLIYWDFDVDGRLLSYDLNSGAVRNLTPRFPVSLNNPHPNSIFKTLPVDIVQAWKNDDSKFIVCDYYDLWEVDPTDIMDPVKLTGRKYPFEHCKFRVLNKDEDHIYSTGDQILISAFEDSSKYNGFFEIKMGDVSSFKRLYMGPCLIYRMNTHKLHFFAWDDGMKPIKAKRANIWLIKKESFDQCPNLFLSNGLRTYRQITFLDPQGQYNWINAELVTYKQLDGSTSQGILYKPQNMDSTKRYPIIFHFYEKLSHRLYEFPYPRYVEHNLDIPFFVSNGYLVFTPDIYYSNGSRSDSTFGDHVCNSVVAAAKILSTRSYVDSLRMGVQGHSFGGGETNYLITHSTIFAAAAEAAGYTDLVSAYLTLVPFGSETEHFSKLYSSEVGNIRIGGTLWDRQHLFIRASPVLSADKVVTPLLMMHNRRDNQIQWHQAVEFYMALRRLKKKVWLLQYTGASHTLGGDQAKDYTLRLRQFFDYYLKSGLPPKWMMQGIPVTSSGKFSALEYDSTGSIP